MALKIHLVPAREIGASALEAWSAIQESDPSLASPFFRPEFTAQVAAVREDVHVGILESAGEPVGFFPFQKDGNKVGTPVGGRLSDYHGVIAKKETPWDPRRLIRACDLVEWQFDHVPAVQAALSRFRQNATHSPLLDLSHGYEAYAQERRTAGSEQIKKTTALRRKLEREVGALRCEMHSNDTAILCTLMRWKSRQYVEAGKTDIFAIPWIVAVIEKIQGAQSGHFAGMLSVLFAGEQPISAHFGMRSRTVWHYWLPAYDHDFGKYSPGLILLLEMAKQAQALGIQTIDLGKGDVPYKQRLMNGSVPLVEGVVPASPLRAAYITLRAAVKEWVRR